MSGFKSDAQRKYFFANGFGSVNVSTPIDADEAYRLSCQRNDDRIYASDYDRIRAGESASPDAFAAYFRSAEVEAMNRKETDYLAMWSADSSK